MASLQRAVLVACGRRFARVVADAQPGNVITASVKHCNATADEIDTWINRGWIVDNGSDLVFKGIGKSEPADEGQVL